MTTAYTVTAGNCAFWQKLVVLADSSTEASALFRAHLTSPDSVKAEDDEHEMALAVADDSQIETDREAYRYRFDERDIETFDGDSRWTGEATAEVRMMYGGQNG